MPPAFAVLPCADKSHCEPPIRVAPLTEGKSRGELELGPAGACAAAGSRCVKCHGFSSGNCERRRKDRRGGPPWADGRGDLQLRWLSRPGCRRLRRTRAEAALQRIGWGGSRAGGLLCAAWTDDTTIRHGNNYDCGQNRAAAHGLTFSPAASPHRSERPNIDERLSNCAGAARAV